MESRTSFVVHTTNVPLNDLVSYYEDLFASHSDDIKMLAISMSLIQAGYYKESCDYSKTRAGRQQ